MHTLTEYIGFATTAKFGLMYAEDVSEAVKRTWDIAIELIVNPSFWSLALSQGSEFVNFLHAFKAMRDGFASRTFVYGLLTAIKH